MTEPDGQRDPALAEIYARMDSLAKLSSASWRYLDALLDAKGHGLDTLLRGAIDRAAMDMLRDHTMGLAPMLCEKCRPAVETGPRFCSGPPSTPAEDGPRRRELERLGLKMATVAIAGRIRRLEAEAEASGPGTEALRCANIATYLRGFLAEFIGPAWMTWAPPDLRTREDEAP